MEEMMINNIGGKRAKGESLFTEDAKAITMGVTIVPTQLGSVTV